MKEPFAVGFYLGVPVHVFTDYGNGWVEAQYPDNLNPGRAHKQPKPFAFTGRGPDAWCGRMWRDQIVFPKLLARSVRPKGANPAGLS